MRLLASLSAALLLVGCATPLPDEVRETTPGLIDRALVKPDAARALALAHLPGGKLEEIRIVEDRGGGLWYHFGIVLPGDIETYLRVDANNGHIFEPATEEEESGEMAHASIKDATAREMALARVGGGRIVKAEFEKEDGVPVYSYDIFIPGGSGVTEVQVDATTGHVVVEAQ